MGVLAIQLSSVEFPSPLAYSIKNADSKSAFPSKQAASEYLFRGCFVVKLFYQLSDISSVPPGRRVAAHLGNIDLL